MRHIRGWTVIEMMHLSQRAVHLWGDCDELELGYKLSISRKVHARQCPSDQIDNPGVDYLEKSLRSG